MRQPSRITWPRRISWTGPFIVLTLAMGTEIVTGRATEDSTPGKQEVRVISAKSVVTPPAPVLPATAVAALQEGRYADAEAELSAWQAKATEPADKTYGSWIKGIAQRLGGKADAARKTLREALDASPKGRWAAKIRAELASVELAAGRAAEAEALARAEAESLLAGDRKDQLAQVYQNFANRLLKPDDPITPADPKAAYDLLSQARSLAKGLPIRARLLLEMAKAGRLSGNPGQAIQDFQSYLKENPKGADRTEARYLLGESQRDAGQGPPSRLTWTDLARDLEGQGGDPGEFRAKALYGIALTYGVPSPANDLSLNLGVAALKRFQEAYPAHPLAVTAGYEIGASALARGKSDQALDAFGRFLKGEGFRAETDEAKRNKAQLEMTATFQVGQILQRQGNFDEAIAAWRGYLAKFPNGPQSASAQSSMVATQLLIAEDHLAHERFDEARAAWQAYVTQNPLDGRIPDLLYKVGESFLTQKKPDRAITAWEPLLSKFPNSQPAAHAQFQIALIFETEKGDPEAAIERFRKIAIEPWRAQGAQRVAVMESRVLRVVTPRTFRSGQTPHLKITTRNLETLTFSAYKLNAESYFRKKHAMQGVEALDIGLVAPDAEWTVPVANYAKFKPIETTYDLTKIEVPGVYVVKVTDEKHLQATTLVIGSDIDVILKTSNEQILVFAQDMKTGKGRPNARVLVAEDGKVVFEAKTGQDGVLLQKWETPRSPGSEFAYLVIDGAHVAGSDLGIDERIAQGLSPRAYIYTDRPAYRPGQQVALRGVVREISEGQYALSPKAVYKLEVTDSRGRLIVARDVALSDFGTFHQTLPLDSGAPVGTYRVRLHQPGKSDFAGAFEVQSYRLEALDLSFDLPKTVYFRGETVSADLVARYQYGAPAAGRPIAVRLPDGQVIQGETDPTGKFHVEFPTVGFAEEQTLSLMAQLTQDNVAAAASVALVVRAFSISVETTRDTYLSGEPFLVTATTRDFQGEPVGQSLEVALIKQVTRQNQTAEREISRKPMATDPKTGVAKLNLKAEDSEGGTYLIRVSGTDRFGNPVVSDHALEISGEKGETRLLLLADRLTYKVGEEATVNLHSRGASGPALLTWEADRILSYKIVGLTEGNNPVAWAVNGPQFPNFTLAACRMTGTRFDEATLDLNVERDLRVTVTPKNPTVGPGDKVTVEVTSVDQLGRPVAAEVSLALIDRSLLRLFGDKLPSIDQFFYDQSRTGAFTTGSTNTFDYTPETIPVAEAVVEDAERATALAANFAERGRVMDEVRGQVQLNMPAAVAAAPPPAPAEEPSSGAKRMMMGGFGGGRPDLRKEKSAQEGMGFDARFSEPAVGKPADALFDGVDRQPEMEVREDLAGTNVLSRRAAGRGISSMEARPRERFVETAYWNPSVVTGADGKATLTFDAPTAHSRYQFTARGVTGADTLVGQSTAELVVRKDFFVDLKAPAALTQGDIPRFVGRVHHVGVKGTVELRLSVYAGGREQVFPKTLELKGDGVDEVLFDPFNVPDSENVRLTLTARVGEVKDELVSEIPVRPWGVQAFASASGTASDDATVFVGLPPGRSYENPEMLVVVSPTLQRMLIELAMGRDVYVLNERLARCIFPPPSGTTADRASDLLGLTSTLNYLRSTRAANVAPEASRLADHARGLVTELTTLQNQDGGWPWVVSDGPVPLGRDPNQARASDPMTSARVVWALSTAEPLGLLTDPAALEKAAGYLAQEYAKAGAGDQESRAVLLHAMSTRKRANFETANSLNRLRQSLSDASLAYLALTFVNLDRAPMAGEILDLLRTRAKSEPVGPGQKPRTYWGGGGSLPWNRSETEATAMVTLAYALVRPQAVELSQAVEWLLAHRQSFGWQPQKAKGPALAALGSFYGKGAAAEDRYDLVVMVNDTEVHRARILGAAEGKAIPIPRDALKAGDRNRVRFQVEGRGTFGFAVTLTGFTRDFGPDQDTANRSFLVSQHIFMPSEPEYNGRKLPTGFDVTVNALHFENRAKQVEAGGRVRVRLDSYRVYRPGQQPWERDFLVLEDQIPAGTTLVEGSVQTSAARHEVEDNTIRFYFTPDQEPGQSSYDLLGYLPGQYRCLPPILSSAYEPGRRHMAKAGDFDLKVLAPGEKKTDPYKPTPSELYARGKALYDDGKLEEAAGPLEALFAAYTLRDDVAKDAARMLLLIHVKHYDARKVVQYFEVVKEKAPELVITFDDLLVIGRAYRDINEHERAFLVWRGVSEASYLEDARVGEVLRQRGRTLEGIAYLLDLWREYPNSASIESDFFGVAQVIARQAGEALNNPPLRKELADAGVTRSELLLQAIRVTQAFLSQAPDNPVADEASLALVGNFLALEDYPAVVKLSARFAKIYPKSTFLDSFQYSEALGEFHLGHHDRAVEVAKAIAEATYKDPTGVDQPSPNKWQAVYILGQIFDARREPAKALEYYRQVAERFTDAADAVTWFTHKALALPEVTVVHPPQSPKVAEGAGGFRNVGVGRDESKPDPKFPDEVKLRYRNIAEADVKVYPVDLMRLYLTRRNLDAIAGIDLAGITPLVETTIKLGDGEDFAEKLRKLDLGLKKEGAYLVMVRGDNLYASGIVLVSPLTLEVQEDSRAGRVRVTVRDAVTGDLMPKVQVKVIGSGNGNFLSGDTDLRGVFVAEGVQGEAAAVARKGTAQYAFYRGKTPLGEAQVPQREAKDQKAGQPASPRLEENVQMLNGSNQMRQIERLEQRYKAMPAPDGQGGMGGAAAGGFR